MSDADEHVNRRHDRLDVEIDGEEREVFNWVSVELTHRIRPTRREAFNPRISGGDLVGGAAPDAVTKWLADEIQREYQIDVEDHGIDVVDIESEEVTML